MSDPLDRLFFRIVLGLLMLLALAQCCAGCQREQLPEHQPAPVAELELPEHQPFQAQAVAEPSSSELEVAEPGRVDERRSWCEPVVPAVCQAAADCPPAPDGSAQRCVLPWWSEREGSDLKVCSPAWPTKAKRRALDRRIRVLVDELCSRRRGCDPNDLARYLGTIQMRESSKRPWKRHRLDPDVRASSLAWSKLREVYLEAGNPAAGDPDRWLAGAGLYGMLPAYWVATWDPAAPPEVLCGEVEATVVHLRAARRTVSKLRHGVDCDGDGEREFFGTGELGSPSWYDVSRGANSGSLCPGDRAHQKAWEARATRAGLDPYGPVSVASLGADVPDDVDQDEWAAAMRLRMAAAE